MVIKNTILQRCEKFLTNKRSFAYRVCKLLKDGDFFQILSSQELTHLLNEGAGKKIKVNCLTALMEPLLKEDIIKIKILGKGRNKRKFWFPGWIDKQKVGQEIVSSSTSEEVLFFTGKDSWTDPNKNFPKIIDLLKGNLCIVDPFYGNGTFYVLEKFGKNRKIRFLSCRPGTEEQGNITKFGINLKRFRKEFKNIAMRKYDKPYELHDRYIIADNALIIVGHGIKDLADKESFVVFLPRKLVTKFLPVLKKSFEERWGKSQNLK
ncbi:MAG TPA: hypothetical protein VF399_08225 [bacterium]